MHSSIATIFGTNVAKKVDNQNILYFPTSPNSASALLGETGTPESASFHSNDACLFTTKTRNTVKKYYLVRAEPPFTVKTIDWEHQTGSRKGA